MRSLALALVEHCCCCSLSLLRTDPPSLSRRCVLLLLRGRHPHPHPQPSFTEREVFLFSNLGWIPSFLPFPVSSLFSFVVPSSRRIRSRRDRPLTQPHHAAAASPVASFSSSSSDLSGINGSVLLSRAQRRKEGEMLSTHQKSVSISFPRDEEEDEDGDIARAFACTKCGARARRGSLRSQQQCVCSIHSQNTKPRPQERNFGVPWYVVMHLSSACVRGSRKSFGAVDVYPHIYHCRSRRRRRRALSSPLLRPPRRHFESRRH